jgi:predicted esterase YcpF (UPF0227 family)
MSADSQTQRPSHLLYLHGFRSSPRSVKSQRVLGWLAANRPEVTAWCPQLPPSPAEAMAMVEAGIAAWPREHMAVMGSSLGGFYATWVAERHGCPAVLLNPAVDPARDLAKYIGEQTAFHDPTERFFFRAEFIDQLRALTVAALAPAALPGPHRQGRRAAGLARDERTLPRRAADRAGRRRPRDLRLRRPPSLPAPLPETDLMRLQDKICIVTGAAQGIGLATA